MSDLKKSTILVPTDFTPEADCAINHAIKIAKAAVDDIKLLHVINNETKSKLKKEGKSTGDLSKMLDEKAKAITAAHGVAAGYELREGSIFNIIGDVAEEINAGLMVFGTHGVRGVQRIVGSYALKVAKDSPVPVIIVQNKEINDNGYKKIILPIDSYIEEKQKVFHVSAVAKLFNAEVVLFVAHESDEFLRNDVLGNEAFIRVQLEERNIRHKIVEQDSKGPGFAKQVIELAAKENADLITIMTQKGKSLGEFILGPNNEKVINNDHQIAVMCVNPLDSHVYTASVFSM